MEPPRRPAPPLKTRGSVADLPEQPPSARTVPRFIFPLLGRLASWGLDDPFLMIRKIKRGNINKVFPDF
jgi:hypothetical protein